MRSAVRPSSAALRSHAQPRRAAPAPRLSTGARRMATQNAPVNRTLPKITFEQMDSWLTKRERTVADFHAGKASREDVAALAVFVKYNAFTPELFQAGEKIQKLRKEDKKEALTVAMKEFEKLADVAVAEREKAWDQANAKSAGQTSTKQTMAKAAAGNGKV